MTTSGQPSQQQGSPKGSDCEGEEEQDVSNASTEPAQEEEDKEDTRMTGDDTIEMRDDPQDDDEWEVVDEAVVYANCVGAVESELMEPGKPVLLLDLDTDKPLIQVSASRAVISSLHANRFQ